MRFPAEIHPGVDYPAVAGQFEGRHGKVLVVVAATEMQGDNLSGREVDDAGAGIAAERRTVMRGRRDDLAEAFGRRAAMEFAGLQPFHAILLVEQLVLLVDIVARIEGRISDHCHLVPSSAADGEPSGSRMAGTFSTSRIAMSQ